jgi:hypothetical protein
MKSAAEGSEIQLTWPATIPSSSGVVTAVSADRIDTLLSSGRRQSYRLTRSGTDRRLVPHVAAGDGFGDGDTVIASIMDRLVPLTLPVGPAYDFMPDLGSTSTDIVYSAVKALGHLAERRDESVPRLQTLMTSHTDRRVCLEAAASLARLGDSSGLDMLAAVLHDQTVDAPLRMEAALILAELPSPRSIDELRRVMMDAMNPSELRAAGAWGMGGLATDPAPSGTLVTVGDRDEVTAVHAICALERLIRAENLSIVLAAIGDDARQSAGIVRALAATNTDIIGAVVAEAVRATATRRNWLLYLLASLGRERCADSVRAQAPALMTELEFFWAFHSENWTNRLDVADQLDYQQQQLP